MADMPRSTTEMNNRLAELAVGLEAALKPVQELVEEWTSSQMVGMLPDQVAASLVAKGLRNDSAQTEAGELRGLLKILSKRLVAADAELGAALNVGGAIADKMIAIAARASSLSEESSFRL